MIDDEHTDRGLALPSRRLVLAVLVLCALGVGAGFYVLPSDSAPDARLTELPTHDSFVVVLAPEGASRVAFVRTYNLSNPQQRAQYAAIAENETLQMRLGDVFLRRMQRVAAAMEPRVNRGLRVRDPGTRVVKRHGVGTVAVSVTFEGLAIRHETTIRVVEPFASTYDPPLPLVVQVPDGYEVTAARPRFDSFVGNTAIWRAGTNLDSFSLALGPKQRVFTPPQWSRPQAPDPISGLSGGWFPIAVAAVAILAEIWLYVLYRRRYP